MRSVFRDQSVSVWGAAVLVLLLLGLWVCAAGPRESVAALGFAGVGVWMVFCPPANRLPAFVMLGGGLCLLLPLLAFLPYFSGGEQEWRKGLENAGIPLGGGGVPQVEISLATILWQAGAGLVTLRLLAGGYRQGSECLLLCLLTGAFVTYGLLSLIRPMLIPAGAYSIQTGIPTFGFFPNHNHSGTLLAMGLVLALGLFLQGARRRWALFVVLGLLGMVALAWWLVFTNLSRAGLLLGFLGAGAVLVLELRRRRGRGMKWVLCLCLLLGALVFYAAEDGVKKRLVEQLESVEEHGPKAGTGLERLLESRWQIYRDTSMMIAARPLVGSGAGQFADLYPQYQKHSLKEAGGHYLHPESSWLWLAAEGGVPMCLGCLGVVGFVFWQGGRATRSGRDRGLRQALLVAALIPFLHGLVDVPLHRESILWISAFLVGLVLPEGRELGPGARWAWRVVGAAVALVGMLGVLGLLKSPVREAEERLLNARVLLQKDEEVASAMQGQQGEGEEPDLLEEALGELQVAAALRPLDRRVHALRGNIALYFDDKDEEARESFIRARLLEPSAARVPFRQGLAWIAIDRDETAELWKEALQRARGREVVLRDLFRQMLRRSLSYPRLRRFCAESSAMDREFRTMIVQSWSTDILVEDQDLLRREFKRMGDLNALRALEGRVSPRP